MADLFSSDTLVILFIVSAVGFVASLIAIPFILIRLPANYFEEHHPRSWMENHHPMLRLAGHVLKNVAGVVFFLAGVAMLFLPGQGILTILVGLSLIDFPGKRPLERKLVGLPTVLRTINKLRAKFGKPPLTVTQHH